MNKKLYVFIPFLIFLSGCIGQKVTITRRTKLYENKKESLPKKGQTFYVIKLDGLDEKDVAEKIFIQKIHRLLEQQGYNVTFEPVKADYFFYYGHGMFSSEKVEDRVRLMQITNYGKASDFSLGSISLPTICTYYEKMLVMGIGTEKDGAENAISNLLGVERSPSYLWTGATFAKDEDGDFKRYLEAASIALFEKFGEATKKREVFEIRNLDTRMRFLRKKHPIKK